jgi:phospholipid/cholesterol/gamma-HCH transport system ATP-binding protein
VLLGSSGTGKSVFLRSQIILRDEPDSGLAVRTAYLPQLLIDINASIDATILIVTHRAGQHRHALL